MSRSRARRFPTLTLAVLLLLAPVAASAEPAVPLDVSRVVQLLLSFLTGDGGSGLDPSGLTGDNGPGLDPSGLTGDAGPGLDPSGASTGDNGSGLDPSGRS
jgi:hypothetical protein